MGWGSVLLSHGGHDLGLGSSGPGLGHGCLVVFKVLARFVGGGAILLFCLVVVLIGFKYHELGDTAEYKAPGCGKASKAKFVVGD